MAGPTADEIREKAEEMYVSDRAAEGKDYSSRPEVEELKETGYYYRAKQQLMREHGGEYRERAQRAREFRAKPQSASLEASSTQAKPTAKIRVVHLPKPSFGRAGAAVKGAISSYRASKATERAKMEEVRMQAIKRAKADAEIEKKAFEQGRQRGIYLSSFGQGAKLGAAQAKKVPPKRGALLLPAFSDPFLTPPRRAPAAKGKTQQPRPAAPPVFDSLLGMGGGLLPAAPRAVARRSPRATNDIDALLG